MTAASTASIDHDVGQGLSTQIQAHLGRLLGDAYAKLPSPAPAIPPHLSGLLDRLTSTLATLAERDERAFRAELEALMPTLFRYAMKLTKSHPRADDLVQDTLLRAWRARARFAVGTNLGAWLFTIMRNGFFSGGRKSLREAYASEDDQSEGPATVPDQLDKLDLQDVQRALDGLREPMRQALLLVAVEGLSYEDAADVMNCQIGTVKSRVSRAREQLCRLVGYTGGDLGTDHVTLSVVSGQGAATRV